MSGSFQNRKFFIATSDVFKKQAAFGTAVAQADINKRHPQLTPTYPTNQITRDRVTECTGEYPLIEEISSRLKRLRFSLNPSAQIAAGWLALAFGTAAAATGTPADETQTLTITAGDPYTLSFTFEGLTGTTAEIAIDATAATVAAALNAIRSIKQGTQNAANVAVSGSAGGPYTITFQNKLAKANVPLLVSSEVTAAITAGTAGANKLHALSRSTADQPPQTSLIYGFDGDADDPKLLKNVVVNQIDFIVPEAGFVSMDLDLIATWEAAAALAYSIPACINFVPIRRRDCRVEIDSVFYAEIFRSGRYTYSNNIFTGDDPFPFDDIDAIRLEKGDRTSSFSGEFYGSSGDTLYDLAEGETQEPWNLHLGVPGDRLSIYAPSTKLRLAETDTAFAGEANRSVFNIEGEPFYAEGDAGTPDHAEAYIAQTTQYLTS